VDVGTFAAVLKRERLAAGLTQKALAERALVSARAISDLESGVKQAPHVRTIELLADALRLPDARRSALAAVCRHTSCRWLGVCGSWTRLCGSWKEFAPARALWRWSPANPVSARHACYRSWRSERARWAGRRSWAERTSLPGCLLTCHSSSCCAAICVGAVTTTVTTISKA
jgi:transcriptional regulator with XRE-family HTH domain